ncbi:DNA-processing protein DprA [Fulvivirga lutea]|uniref:DNA-processing protein DprA n=1 Tax=Fulvivirga lutea TaxID=2810512 RepID=A0A975A006_9BACT|nr:DNA-processing protein DprA [Fulvivirga lutea]QSE96700.1 DNA-processing protein DprA [Fulvivirga lutea]
MDQQRVYQVALNFIPGIGHMLVKQLVSYCGSAEQVFKTTKGKLLKIPGIGEHTASLISSDAVLKRAEDELNNCEKHGTEILLYTDKTFPKRLKQINDAPSLIYVKGKADLNNEKVVSIVGTRKATEYGKRLTEELIEQLTPHNPLIISGLAYGIDIAAHKASLKHNLSTVGVMASGIDIIYPAIHRETSLKMLENGALITENPIGSKPDAHRFPARNRIIAGMCDAVVVIEAAKKGGALITANIANSYNKDVFAVPGDLKNEFSEGCNALIKSNQAHLIQSAKDIEYIMNWEASAKPMAPKLFDTTILESNEKLVVEELQKQKEAILIDNLSWTTQLEPSKLASILLNLEFKGYVNSLPGKRFRLATRK